MAVNQVNVGRDVTLSVTTPEGLLQLDILTSFDSRPRYDRRRSKPINGPPLSIPIPDGHEGTFELDRTNNVVEAFYARLEAGYYAGRGIAPSAISETIVNADGSVTTYQYKGVMFFLEDSGRKQADDVIKIRVGWEASQKIQLV